MADRSGTSPAFTPPTPSTDPDNQIERVKLTNTEWGARASQLTRDAKNDFPVKNLSNGQ